MDDLDGLREEIANNMQLKTTEELLAILDEHDSEAWSDTAFEVVKEVLIRRTGQLPETFFEPDEHPGKPDRWKSVNWRRVYARSQRQLLQRTNLRFGLAVFISVVMLFFVILTLDLTVAIVAFFFLAVFVSLLGWSLRRGIREQKANRLVLEARVFLKSDSGSSRSAGHWAEIAVRDAFEITPDGQVLATSSRTGHREVLLPSAVFDSFDEQDEIDLLCLSNGVVLGAVEEYTDS
jgi:hypothetical protein